LLLKQEHFYLLFISTGVSLTLFMFELILNIFTENAP